MKKHLTASDLEIGDWIDTNEGYKQVTSLSILGGDVIGAMVPIAAMETYYAELYSPTDSTDIIE